MSDRPTLELKIDRTQAYVIMKGRLPKDAGELYDYLNEFTEFLQKENQLMQELIREHMMCCNRPIIIGKI